MGSPISEWVSRCLNIFSIIAPRIEREAAANRRSNQHALWEDEQGRLRLWAENIGAHQTGQSALDFRLRDASHIRQQIINILQKLYKDLQEADEISSENSSPKEIDRPDSSSSDEEPEAELHQLHQMIVTSIKCLFQMSILVRKPSRHDFLRVPEYPEISAIKPWDQNHVRDKFPKAQNDIVERLGLAMTRRRQYLRYRERHRAKLSKGIDRAQDVNENTAEDATILLSETIATDAGRLHLVTDDVRSEAGVSQTSYGSAMLQGGSITIPSRPKESIGGAPFECPYCFLMISISSSLSWHRHLFEDLQPYICTVSGCSTPQVLYSSRREWLRHLKESHPRSWRGNTGGSCIAESPYGDSEPFTGTCTLCNDESQSEQQFVRHLAGHLQELALFVLPHTENDSNESDISAEQKNLQELVNSQQSIAAGHVEDVDSIASADSFEAQESKNLHAVIDESDKKRKALFKCLEAGCNYMTKRPRDLERHQGAKHFTTEDLIAKGSLIDCPYGGCGYEGRYGLKSKDHLRDHCKRYHSRDLPKSLGGSGEKWT